MARLNSAARALAKPPFWLLTARMVGAGEAAVSMYLTVIAVSRGLRAGP